MLTAEERRRMKSSSFGLPKKRLFPLLKDGKPDKGRAVSAIAYSKKLARERKITSQERDIVLRKIHKRYPDIEIN